MSITTIIIFITIICSKFWKWTSIAIQLYENQLQWEPYVNDAPLPSTSPPIHTHSSRSLWFHSKRQYSVSDQKAEIKPFNQALSNSVANALQLGYAIILKTKLAMSVWISDGMGNIRNTTWVWSPGFSPVCCSFGSFAVLERLGLALTLGLALKYALK